MNAQQRLQAQPAQHPAAHLQHAPPVAPPVVNQQPQRVPPPVAIAPGANPLHQQPLTHRITFHELPEEEKRANRPRFEGYRVFTRWIASDQTYFLIRKFTSLNVRIILSLQDEIVELEQQLTELDEDWSRDPLPASVNYPIPNLIHNGTFRQDVATMRTQLLTSLTEKVFYYSEALLSFPIFLASLVRYSNLVELVHCTLFGLVYSLSLHQYVNEYARLARQPPPDPKDIKNVEHYLEEHVTAIDDAEVEYISRHEDLISVQPKIRSWFRGIIEMTQCLRLPGIKQCFTREPADYNIINDGQGYWQNDSRVENLSTALIAFVGLGMLIGPLWWLNKVQVAEKRLGIITGFIALFFVLVAVATTARVVDALAAAAAYSAVLMVFMQLQVSASSGH